MVLRHRNQKFSSSLYAGIEYSKRERDVPFLFPGPPEQTFNIDVNEYSANGYLYWLPRQKLAFKISYNFDKRANGDFFDFGERVVKLRTNRITLNINYFHPNGFNAGLISNYINQKGDFLDFQPPFLPITQRENSLVFDAFLKYRLPNRYGILSVNIDNIFNKKFRFQDVDPENPGIKPERVVTFRFTLAFK